MSLPKHATEGTESDLPFVFLNVAITADGKLSPANRHFQPFSSKRDQELLMILRTRADAVMAGARTVDTYPVNLGPGSARYRRMRLKNGLAEYNIRVVVSGSGTLDVEAEIFKHRFSPLLVLTTERAGKNRIRRLARLADEVKILGDSEIDFAAALRWLRKQWGVKKLLCEGGGEINGALFRAGLVNQIYVTLCPVIFGGRTAPTMADGIGIPRLAEAIPVREVSWKRAGDELFMVYDVLKPETS